MSEVITLTNENFEDEVLKSDKPVLVDFWASWCGPCKMQGPIFEEVAASNNGDVKFAKANVEELEDIAREYKIRSIPTLVLFKNGEAIDKAVGLQQKEEIEKLIK